VGGCGAGVVEGGRPAGGIIGAGPANRKEELALAIRGYVPHHGPGRASGSQTPLAEITRGLVPRNYRVVT